MTRAELLSRELAVVMIQQDSDSHVFSRIRSKQAIFFILALKLWDHREYTHVTFLIRVNKIKNYILEHIIMEKVYIHNYIAFIFARFFL